MKAKIFNWSFVWLPEGRVFWMYLVKKRLCYQPQWDGQLHLFTSFMFFTTRFYGKIMAKSTDLRCFFRTSELLAVRQVVKMKQAAMAAAAEFTWSNAALQYEQIFTELGVKDVLNGAVAEWGWVMGWGVIFSLIFRRVKPVKPEKMGDFRKEWGRFCTRCGLYPCHHPELNGGCDRQSSNWGNVLCHAGHAWFPDISSYGSYASWLMSWFGWDGPWWAPGTSYVKKTPTSVVSCWSKWSQATIWRWFLWV